MQASEQKQEDLLWLRFFGPSLESQSMPIYDLGTALIAIQRMVYKAHQARPNTLKTSASPPPALQIAAHSKGSDAYSLKSFYADSDSIGYMNSLIQDILNAISIYVHGQADVLLQEPSSSNDMLGLAVYQDVARLADRTDPDGEVRGIEIGLTHDSKVATHQLKIDYVVRDYIKTLRSRSVPGAPRDLTGQVSKLDFVRAIAELHVGPRHNVKVQLNEQGIERLRTEAMKESSVTVHGHPMHRFGKDLEEFDRFNADEIVDISNPRNQ